jgi:hypothetical protein
MRGWGLWQSFFGKGENLGATGERYQRSPIRAWGGGVVNFFSGAALLLPLSLDGSATIAQMPRNSRLGRDLGFGCRMSRLILLALLAPFSRQSRRRLTARRLGDSFAVCSWSADDARADVVRQRARLGWLGGETDAATACKSNGSFGILCRDALQRPITSVILLIRWGASFLLPSSRLGGSADSSA